MTEQEAKSFVSSTEQVMAMCKVIYDKSLAVGFTPSQAITFAIAFFQSAVFAPIKCKK